MTATKREIPHRVKKKKSALSQAKENRRARQKRFLSAYSDTATLAGACRITRVGRRTHFDWLAADPLYARKFATVNETVVEDLEEECNRRAKTGCAKPIFYRGEKISTVYEKSDILLMFLLKARRPEIYREKFDVKAEQTVTDAATEEILKHMSDEKLAELKVASDTVAKLLGR